MTAKKIKIPVVDKAKPVLTPKEIAKKAAEIVRGKTILRAFGFEA
jgi:hypothetical protein